MLHFGLCKDLPVFVVVSQCCGMIGLIGVTAASSFCALRFVVVFVCVSALAVQFFWVLLHTFNFLVALGVHIVLHSCFFASIELYTGMTN